MAIYVADGVIKQDNKTWYRHRILNDELTQVYEITLSATNVLGLKAINRPERTKLLIDKVTGIRYFLAIVDRYPNDSIYEPILYLDSSDCPDTCTKLDQLQLSIDSLAVNTTSPWKII